MPDLRLRRFARAAAKQPDDLDLQAALLRERLRAGELSDEQIDVAGLFGYAPAQLVFHGRLLPRLDYEVWVDRVRDVDRHTGLCAALAAARMVPTLIDREERGLRQRITAHLLAAEELLSCPCSDHATQLRQLERHYDRMGAAYRPDRVLELSKLDRRLADQAAWGSGAWEVIDKTARYYYVRVLRERFLRLHLPPEQQRPTRGKKQVEWLGVAQERVRKRVERGVVGWVLR